MADEQARRIPIQFSEPEQVEIPVRIVKLPPKCDHSDHDAVNGVETRSDATYSTEGTGG